MRNLHDYFFANNNRLMHKWLHYFYIYERHFDRFVGKQVNLMEIGVFQGGSLQMWKHYLGDRATIYGVDIDPKVKLLEEERIQILIGDQGNRDYWTNIKPSLPVFDIIIDDGGHSMDQQRITFEEMFPVLSPHGVYVVEDMHTSYWSEYGGGFEHSDSFMEYSKRLIDKLNAWHSRDSRLTVDKFTESAWSMSYYDSILVIEKRPRVQPSSAVTGTPSW
ncbi:class I SAM-dependent methyltransferase [Paenibacillus alkaliterrae]|uniref:class I SAM-dependent methyltransferase n=1 Tax=Paenibacillus alkaliterrae TaxID=320909 RepID=UPI001F1F2BFD|nr:class I SAM-dependent methyltransferase [Paenibacillus alkaliterrae]MCF2938578.1 class I SAM-dependent methyltransferase [Paenibacillus alkaliterrae]